MKILSSEQMRLADSYTIEHEPVSSFALMERSGKACFDWIIKNTKNSRHHTVVCGTGNNGGDGLVIGRLLAERKLPVEIIILSSSSKFSDDFSKNLDVIKKSGANIRELREGDRISLKNQSNIIDAIFGTGLGRPVDGWLGECIEEINNSSNEIISIDLPSGLFADRHSTGKVIQPNHTLTFQSPKLAFLFAENEKFVGEFHVLDIGLDEKFVEQLDCRKFLIEESIVRNILKPRRKFSHKGIYGHSLLISGSKGKIGAAVIAGGACLRSGTGLLTIHVPQCGYEILQSSLPEAMVDADINEDLITQLGGIENFDAIGIGPGIGKAESTKKMLFDLLDKSHSPMVIDADALNILSDHPEKIKIVPSNSILTPHPKEFERLAGKSTDDFDRHKRQIKFSKDNNVIVVLKGAHTCVSFPDGRAYFNSTGNPGMAKGGSGDALTGMILAFLAQHYSPEQSALLGVYVHGLAGDFAAEKKGEVSMICSDLIEYIPKAIKQLVD
jgi:hydroxyethylthiazole kinase-like uncharacterized protein yjeF